MPVWLHFTYEEYLNLVNIYEQRNKKFLRTYDKCMIRLLTKHKPSAKTASILNFLDVSVVNNDKTEIALLEYFVTYRRTSIT